MLRKRGSIEQRMRYEKSSIVSGMQPALMSVRNFRFVCFLQMQLCTNPLTLFANSAHLVVFRLLDDLSLP